MNKKSKLSKLKLTSSKRENKQISNFLSNTNLNENTENSNSLKQSSIETRAKGILKETEPILLLSDDDDDNVDVKKTKITNSLEEQKVDNSEGSKIKRKTVVSEFFNESLNDFEVSVAKNNAEKMSLKEKLIKTKGKNTKRKKQTTIKSAFTKNEEIFSNLMAQHSIAENFNPEEMQLALAYSISETENNSINSNEFKEPVICTSENSNKIRERLQQYGFKTNSNTEDYDIKYFLPKGKSKAKWANKFTSLTLRCPEKQKRKLEENIENFLSTQFIETHTCNESPFQFKLTSTYLKTLVPDFDTIKYFRKSLYMEMESSDNEIFYVTDLFEPTKSKPGSLLRNFKDIPGRDLSPEKPSKTNNTVNESMNQNIIIEENIIHNIQTFEEFGHSKKSLNFDSAQLDCLKLETSIPNTNIIVNLNSNFSIEVENDNIKSKDCLVSPECKRAKIDSELLQKETLEINYNRAESPDIFALSDEELYASETCHYNSPSKKFEIFLNHSYKEHENDNVLANNLNESTTENEVVEAENILIYEQFSSDEVKVFGKINSENSLKSNKTNISTDMGKVIDLTQSEESMSDLENNGKYSTNSSPNNISSISREDYINKNNNVSNEIQLNISENFDSVNKFENCSKSLKNYETINQSINIDDVKVNSPLQLISPKQINISPTKSFLRESTENAPFNSIIVCDLTQDEMFDLNLSKNSKISNVNELSSVTSNNLDDSCIILSDDEVNYSIINSAKKNVKLKKNLQEFNNVKEHNSKVKEQEISLIDFIDENDIDIELNNLQCNESCVDILEDNLYNKPNSSSLLTPNKSNRSFDNNDFDSFFTNKRSTYTNEKLAENDHEEKDISIITDIQDETFDLNNLRRKYGLTKTNKTSSCKKSLSESFLKIGAGESNFQRYSTFTKSHKLSDNATFDSKENYLLKSSFEDFDEFDKLVYGSPVKNCQKPNDFVKLLTAEINKFSPIKTSYANESFEFVNDGKVYLIKTQNVPLKPDYNRMDSPTRLKELYKLGLKPLKRKQAITMLEYIYNQTHPFLLEKTNSNENFEKDFIDLNIENNERNNLAASSKSNQLQLQDFFWEELCDIEEKTTFPENELYIFQTNISKKISTALLPFHIAWSNLVQSNIPLKETILHFEPVDLQEIYIFFKSIGYRYDPKDIKKYFDSKCIIFRYDLNNTGNRHVRKNKTKF